MRVAIVLLVVLLTPGTAVVRLIGLATGLGAAVVTVTTGLAITEVVSLTLMYLHVWSWQAVLVTLCTLSAAMALVPVARESRAGAPQ